MLADVDDDLFPDELAGGPGAGGGLEGFHIHFCGEEIAAREFFAGFGLEVKNGLGDFAGFSGGRVDVTRVRRCLFVLHSGDGHCQRLNLPAFEQVRHFEKAGGVQVVKQGGGFDGGCHYKNFLPVIRFRSRRAALQVWGLTETESAFFETYKAITADDKMI